MRLAALFSDHAVLQRDQALPVWGWTTPDRVVSLRLDEVEIRTVSDGDGRFDGRFPPQPAGGPHTLVAHTHDAQGGIESTITVRDVHVGEVWIASGQSNMKMNVAATGETPWIDEPPPDGVRMFTVPRNAGVGVRRDVDAAWQVAGAEHTPGFSAAGYFFAARLARELGVAVGILHSSWGGTIVEAWTSRATLAARPAMRARLARRDADVNHPSFWENALVHGVAAMVDERARKERSLEMYCSVDPGNEGLARGWAAADFNDADWPSMTLPGAWTRRGHATTGVFWFRRTVEIPAERAGHDLTVHLGAADKSDTTYWNGVEIGRTGGGFDESHWNLPRAYRVPGRLVKAGTNVLSSRVYSFAFDGGLIGPRMAVRHDDGAEIDLAGAWRYAVEHDFGPVAFPATFVPPGPGNPNTPHILFDQMIAPLVPYAMRGAIWYQGESNAGDYEAYRAFMEDLARDWQRHWMQGEFPFLQVQLAGYEMACDYDPSATWPFLREAQFQASGTAGLGMVSALDVGEADDIHPKNKRAVGERLAGWALSRTYGRPDHAAHGPHYAGLTVEGDRLRLHFTGLDGGLATRDGEAPRTFRIADATRRFVPAEARVEGDTVVVWSAEVSCPEAVRYAWSMNPASANLVNGAGLPASSFRTDAWRTST